MTLRPAVPQGAAHTAAAGRKVEMTDMTETGSPARTTDLQAAWPARLAHAQLLVLGMPHLRADGLNLNWLLRECCHAHWWEIGDWAGCAPSELVDAAGRRVLASVVACEVRGDLHRFREDQTVSFRMPVRPSPRNGWRSRSVLSSEAGDSVAVDLVTAFAARAGASNRQLVASEFGGADLPAAGTADTRYADGLRAQGRSDRRAAEADDSPPHASFPVGREVDMNGVGLVYFANFVDFFARTESLVLHPAGPRLALAARRINYFGNIDCGDVLDVVGDVEIRDLAPCAEALVRSYARRRSDGRVIAVCESVRRKHGGG
jgi:probable biosynthetic protein (TIGR04098 family)